MALWLKTPRSDRERVILHALGENRLTITQLATRITETHPEFIRLTYPLLYRVVRQMIESGQLDSMSEPWRCRTRSFVFRTTTSDRADRLVDA
jgi:hypothetical protein